MKITAENVKAIENIIDNSTFRSAWLRGVRDYAIELLSKIDTEYCTGKELDEKILLNGASNWKEYSWGGCSLIYDSQIAASLCNKTELKKTKNGSRKPNKEEEWLDVQARALYQACRMVLSLSYEVEGLTF